MKRTMALISACALLFSLGACGGSNDAADAGTQAADVGAAVGAIELTGNWAGDKPAGVSFKVAMFACPFTMPPAYYSGSNGTLDTTTGDVHLLISDVSAGRHCLMAYVDMNANDGLKPVAGLDAVTTTGLENSDGAIPVDVVAGQTTPLTLTFAVQ